MCVCQESARSGKSSVKLKIIPKVKKEKLHKQKSNSSLSGEPGPAP